MSRKIYYARMLLTNFFFIFVFYNNNAFLIGTIAVFNGRQGGQLPRGGKLLTINIK